MWDLPGGHVEAGEDPKESIVRELREELGVTAPQPSGQPLYEIRTATMVRWIWLLDRWTGTPVNAAPDEHDAVAWFETSDLAGLRLAHQPLFPMLTAVLAGGECFTPPGTSVANRRLAESATPGNGDDQSST